MSNNTITLQTSDEILAKFNDLKKRHTLDYDDLFKKMVRAEWSKKHNAPVEFPYPWGDCSGATPHNATQKDQRDQCGFKSTGIRRCTTKTGLRLVRVTSGVIAITCFACKKHFDNGAAGEKITLHSTLFPHRTSDIVT